MDSANKMLREAYDLDRQGRYSHPQFSQMKASLEEHVAAKESRPLRTLERETKHAMYDPDMKLIINDIADPIAFLTSTHEDDYLNRLDAKNGDSVLQSGDDIQLATPPSFAKMSAREIDREVELRNPLSVHNWLKNHNVNLTLGENDEKSDVAAATAGSGKKTTSRNLAKKVGDRAVERAKEKDDGSPMSSSFPGNKTDLDLIEDELGLDDTPNRGKKPKDSDETYRPKGGRSSKSKRKREDTEPKSGSKKPKTSIGGAAEA